MNICSASSQLIVYTECKAVCLSDYYWALLLIYRIYSAFFHTVQTRSPDNLILVVAFITRQRLKRNVLEKKQISVGCYTKNRYKSEINATVLSKCVYTDF